ncbi:MAG: hypothetical protein ACI3VR_13260 [Intestinibacter sp.]|uniref:hypothetical protein n=1 Tax=Intestinibacter sp. TaxID=1965304 RepID=UPI003F13829B
MKLLKLVGILSLVTVLCTGCYNREYTTESLFSNLPVYNSDKKDLSEEVTRVLGSAALILPSNSTEVGKINEVDLDQNGEDEVVFFEKKEGIRVKNEVGFTILDSNSDGDYDISYTESGNKIKYANFYDLDNDGNKEIILLVENDYMTTLTICRYEDGKVNTLISKNNFNYFNRDRFTKMGIMVKDINDDKILDLIVYNYNDKTNKMNVYACNLENDKLSILDSVSLEDVDNFEEINISIGDITSDGKKALFLSLPYTKKSGYMTDIIYLEDNKFVDAFKQHENIFNSYYVNFEDINKDGITNVPIVDSNSVTIDTLITDATPTSAIVSWNKYNEKKGKDADLLFVNQIYYNYENNFKFLIPNNLVGKIYVTEETEDINNSFGVYKFYYYDSNDFYNTKNEENKKDLFTLNLTEKNIVEDSNNISKSNISVLETEKYVFSISDINEKQLKKFDLTVDIIKEYFSKISE